MNADLTSASIDDTHVLPRPAGAAPGIVAVAWPTGRRIYPYTAAELAAGVDIYTRTVKTTSPTLGAGAGREK